MVRCCRCRKKADVLDDDGLTPYCGSCWINKCSPNAEEVKDE